MGGRINVKADDVLELLSDFGSVDSLNVRMRCGASWWASRIRCTERRLTPAAFASIRPVQWVASPGGGPRVKSTTLCTMLVGQRLFAGLACSCRASTFDGVRHEPRLPSPYHGLRFARSAHNLGGAEAIGCGKDDVGAPHMLLRCAAIRNDRLKTAPIRARDVNDNSCSHNESLNCSAVLGIVRMN